MIEANSFAKKHNTYKLDEYIKVDWSVKDSSIFTCASTKGVIGGFLVLQAKILYK